MDLVGRVTLRNEYEVYRAGTRFVVRSWSGSERHEQDVRASNVFKLAEILRGRAVTVAEALRELERRGFAGLEFRFRWGYKLHFEVQAHLVVLVALGIAFLEKRGRGYVYHVLASWEAPADVLPRRPGALTASCS
jgi:hypothetical protein